MIRYLYCDDVGTREPFEAASDEAAEAVMGVMLRQGDWGQDTSTKTFRVEAAFHRAGPDGEPDRDTGWTVRQTFEPAEPACAGDGYPDPDGHDWTTSGDLIPGGLPRLGSVGSGHGQVRTTYGCSKCGAARISDLGDTDPVNGENLATVEYLPAGTYTTARPVYWSVLSGPAGNVDIGAVEPAEADVAVPAAVLEWAGGWGLFTSDPDAFLVVATEDEATTIPAEVAYLKGTVTWPEDQAIRRALAGERQERGAQS
jgi:hypothetical protein